MLKAKDSIFEENVDGERRVIVSLVADTKEEVIAHGTSGAGVERLQPNDVMQFGSTCLCATGDFGILNSEGVWQFQ